MAWAAPYKVVLGSFAFLIFWTLATFPAVRCLPVGRTAGALLGGTLMVVFQVLSPNQAFAAVDLPILGLLFGTMVISVYLERADLFKYLKMVLSWRCRGAKDLLVRVSVFSALASALFTNDTICVIFTEFVLNLCKQHNLPPEPFLLALASSANIGSATTPIGNPQNLVIAIESKIQFGKFLIGVLPAMIAGIVFNILFLLAMYWRQLSQGLAAADAPPPLPAPADATSDPSSAMELGAIKSIQVISPHNHHSPRRSPLSYERLHSGPLSAAAVGEYPTAAAAPPSPIAEEDDKPTPLYSSRVYSPVHPIAEKQHQLYSPRVHSPGMSPAGMYSPASGYSPAQATAARFYSGRDGQAHHAHHHAAAPHREINEQHHHRAQLREHLTTPKGGKDVTADYPEKLQEATGKEEYAPWYRWGPKLRRKAWMAAVYGVTAGFLAALLSGLNLTWSALTAAVALMVLDFSDAGPSLDRVSYSLLVFFSGMFITVDGFNSTGAPGQFWNAVEPHTRIDSAKGVAILSLVILILSNVASNVPTVLLLGTRVAASAAAIHGASVTRSWLYLAWVSTVAGNFTLIGSAANLIVCEQARQAKPNSYNLTFWAHLKFGIPSTLIVTALGLPLIQG
ncbi:silicon efflux transporter LSI2 [Selaginella moellendorffii]|uniref:silicon efflux transporter LSI2 n=1 Tax=Selaginella moellendorffii TaxID=88036 RepID=UPI000D1CA53B|nr:silicon efflux transporter LSI2 [Selaginella moellendorffii]XP_024545164.1 silicon efflux transporter LSI2 [Selaginella moellendorffii]|eukprot:XP_024545163.1 silicon efflux transporter LSI2 [Selaginella moellendorffii]